MTKPWRILIAALFVGIAGDALLRGGMWRLGFALWITTLAVGVVAIDASAMKGRDNRQRVLLLVGAVLAAFGLVWRDSPMLYAVDMLSVLCMGALTIWHGGGLRLGNLTVIECIRAALLAVVNSIAGAFGVVQQTRVDGGSSAQTTGRARAITIGVVLAAPPLFIVSALLVSSDAVFKTLTDRVLKFLAIDGMQHVFAALALAWVAAGWLRAALGDAIRVSRAQVRSPALAFVSVGVALYALIALLAVFLLTQLRVLFGGETFLMQTQGLTVANYAREGFFQLVLAAGVVLATLVVAEWLSDANDTQGRRRYRTVGTVLLALVLTLLASAVVRMWLYLREFGLSTDRTFACAVMVWVLAALITFAFTTLRGRVDRFAPATLIVTITWVALLNVVNLESLVVRVNVARAVSGKPFDAAYHAALSADALPTLLASSSLLPPTDCKALSDALTKAWGRRLASPTEGGQDWRSRDLPLMGAITWFAERTTSCL